MDITLSIRDDRFAKLKDMASRLHITPEELVQVSIDELLSLPARMISLNLPWITY